MILKDYQRPKSLFPYTRKNEVRLIGIFFVAVLKEGNMINFPLYM